MFIKTGDTVVVISGKDKGKTGKVLSAMPKNDRVVVEGVNIIKKHQKPGPQGQAGGIIEREAAIHVSNVMLYDESVKAGTRVKYEGTGSDKKRISVKSGKEI